MTVFDAYGSWLADGGFRGCAFANAVAEIPDRNHPARAIAREHKAGIEAHLGVLAKDAGCDEPEALAERMLLLLEGATAMAAMRHSGEPFDVARAIARTLIGG